MAFILKLAKICNDHKKFFFTSKAEGENSYTYYHSSRQILDPLTKKIIFYEHLIPDPVLYVTRESRYTNDFETDEQLLEKLRITHVKQPYDAITVSKDLLEKTDALIDMMNRISKNQMLMHRITANKSQDEYKELPYWFSVGGINTISAWVVSHFEARLQY